MKNSFVLSLSFAVALVIAQPSYAVTVGFSEFIDDTLTHTTDEVHSPDRGIVPGEIFVVEKFIHNLSRWRWTDFHIQLQALIGGVWVNSGQGDGISFGDIEDEATFLASAAVDINAVDQGPQGGTWTLSRDTLTDQLNYIFTGFVVNPGDTLSLRFDMSDNDANTWRLVQTATIPEPASLALLGGGLLAFGLFRRRRRS